MGETTAIAWTDHTFNPWWGCERVSPGCQHCYAEAFAKRTGNAVWGKQADRRFFGDKHWAEPLKWDRQAEAEGRPHLVFCASMADVFEDRPELMPDRARLWDLIAETPHLIWQLLTKRPQNVLDMVPPEWHADTPHDISDDIIPARWPANVWIGTTVEDQLRAEERIPELLEVPAPFRFLSCEPLLGPVELPEFVIAGAGSDCPTDYGTGIEYDVDRSNAIDWVICGGESGAGHRPLDLEHARSLRDQCREGGIPFFFKQNSGPRPGMPGPSDLADLKAFPEEAGRADA
jgi:protein gp37